MDALMFVVSFAAAFVFSITPVVMRVIGRTVLFVSIIMAVADDDLFGSTATFVRGVFHPVQIGTQVRPGFVDHYFVSSVNVKTAITAG